MLKPIPAAQKEAANQALGAYCGIKIAPHLRDKVRLVYQWWGDAVALIEQHPHNAVPKRWVDIPIARFKYDCEEGTWWLFQRDRCQRWQFYKEQPDSSEFIRLFEEINGDPTGIFWR